MNGFPLQLHCESLETATSSNLHKLTPPFGIKYFMQNVWFGKNLSGKSSIGHSEKVRHVQLNRRSDRMKNQHCISAIIMKLL